ncbi:MAG: hypothetical protein NTZ90_12390 [Proteobacteria bacterium]|nr:hypothetical protein [Pseudomonadota bacterium]
MSLKQLATAILFAMWMLHPAPALATIFIADVSAGFVSGANTKIKGDAKVYRLSGPTSSISLMIPTGKLNQFVGAFGSADSLENNYHSNASKEVMTTKVYGLTYGFATSDGMVSLSIGLGYAKTLITQSAPVKRIDSFPGWVGRLNGKLGLLGTPAAHLFFGFDVTYRMYANGQESGNPSAKLKSFTQTCLPLMIGVGSSL